MPTKILTCTCKSAFQDETYGLKKRVHNAMQKGGAASAKKAKTAMASSQSWRCTICKATRTG